MESNFKTEVWVVFPEYTQWENRKNKSYYKQDLDYKKAAEAPFTPEPSKSWFSFW